ncbi:MAG: type II secretion system protein [bacterium]
MQPESIQCKLDSGCNPGRRNDVKGGKNYLLFIVVVMKAKKGFTLMELMIVMVILGILFVMLINTYNRISTMVFRVQQEKEVSQEVLQISQIFQNYSDRNTIDYARYT